MQQDTTYQVTILNWTKYNPRADIKSMNWFRCSADLFSHSIWFELTDSGIRVLLFVLCYACKHGQNGAFEITERAACNMGFVQPQSLRAALDTLKRFEIIEFDYDTSHNRTDTYASVRNPNATNVTNVTNVTNETISSDAVRDTCPPVPGARDFDSLVFETGPQKPKFDLESVYAKYPRKESKARGMKKFQRKIKTPADYQCLNQAVDNYVNATQNRERKYVKTWENFFDVWTEWIDKKNDLDAIDYEALKREIEAEEKRGEL